LKREFVISSDLANIPRLRIFLDDFFAEAVLERSNFNMIFLGLSEAVTNSIVHGNRFDENKSVFIQLSYYENNLEIEVRDEGEGFHFECVYDPTCLENIRKERGRGIYLIKKTASNIVFSEGGTRVMIKYTFN
jgi:serine/threonine-protein kinase RsbW